MGTFGRIFVSGWPIRLPLLSLVSPFRPKTDLHKLLLQLGSRRRAKILKMAAMQIIYVVWITLRQGTAQVLIFVLVFLLPLSLTVLGSWQKWQSLFPLSAVHHPTHFGDIFQHIAEKSCCSGSKSQLAAVIWLQNFPLHNARFGTSHYFVLNLILCDSVWFFFSNGKIKRMTVLKLVLFKTQMLIKRNSILDTSIS